MRDQPAQIRNRPRRPQRSHDTASIVMPFARMSPSVMFPPLKPTPPTLARPLFVTLHWRVDSQNQDWRTPRGAIFVLFARQPRPGWEVCGNEAPDFIPLTSTPTR
jgi:hypothetical protein